MNLPRYLMGVPPQKRGEIFPAENFGGEYPHFLKPPRRILFPQRWGFKTLWV